MISLTVNGRPVDVEDGATCLDAARHAGVHIPTLATIRACPPMPCAACASCMWQASRSCSRPASRWQKQATSSRRHRATCSPFAPWMRNGCWRAIRTIACTAKKDEALRHGLSGDVDHVLITRELARMIKSRGIAFHALADDGAFDDPLGESTGAVQLFAMSGGVMAATARHRPGDQDCADRRLGHGRHLQWHRCSQHLLETQAWRDQFVAIEVMACVGGCLGGGGEPKIAGSIGAAQAHAGDLRTRQAGGAAQCA